MREMASLSFPVFSRLSFRLLKAKLIQLLRDDGAIEMVMRLRKWAEDRLYRRHDIPTMLQTAWQMVSEFVSFPKTFQAIMSAMSLTHWRYGWLPLDIKRQKATGLSISDRRCGYEAAGRIDREMLSPTDVAVSGVIVYLAI